MKKTLYLKFIAAYLLFGVFGFIIVATFVTNMMTEHCRRETAEDLYRGATQIASTYAADLYSDLDRQPVGPAHHELGTGAGPGRRAFHREFRPEYHRR